VTPGTHDFDVVRGTSAEEQSLSPLVARFLHDGAAVEFTLASLSVYAKRDDDLRGTFLFRTDTSLVGSGRLAATDSYTSEVTWFMSLDQSRMLRVGAVNYYEMELTTPDGSEVVYLRGTINGIGGLNDDAGAS
jgi:hypothetical protein